MNKVTKALAGVLLAFLLTVPVFAQETVTDTPPTQEAPTTEATVEPVPVEPAPDTTDDVNWLDDVLEALGKLDVATLALGIGFVTLVLQFRKPQTSAEKQLNDDALALKELEAKKTASQLDDLLVTLSRLANSLRPVADSLNATVTPPLSYTNISGTSNDAVITTKTETTIDSADTPLRG